MIRPVLAWFLLLFFLPYPWEVCTVSCVCVHGKHFEWLARLCVLVKLFPDETLTHDSPNVSADDEMLNSFKPSGADTL